MGFEVWGRPMEGNGPGGYEGAVAPHGVAPHGAAGGGAGGTAAGAGEGAEGSPGGAAIGPDGESRVPQLVQKAAVSLTGEPQFGQSRVAIRLAHHCPGGTAWPGYIRSSAVAAPVF